jgi:hypothetical protein
MIKSTINCSENGCRDYVQKYKKLECLCWEEEESWDGWLAAVWDGRGGMGKKKGTKEEKSVGRVGIYWLLPMESPTDTFCRYTRRLFHRRLCHVTVRRSRFESLGHSIGKIIWKNLRHHTVATFQKNYIIRQRYGRYIPTVSPMGIVCQYIPTELETELFSSVIFTDEKISAVIPLVFADFLVMYWSKLAKQMFLVFLYYIGPI